MKKLLITLSFYFVTAYANNGMSGYTELIVENSNLTDDVSATLRPQRASSSETNDFNKPLYDGTYETPINPYSGDIKEFSWKNALPIFSKTNDYPYGFDHFSDECYKAPSAKDCHNLTSICEKKEKKEECINLLKECPKHNNCYESLPSICQTEKPPAECSDLKNDSEIPIIYISVKKGESASFDYNFPDKIYDKYCLIRYDYIKDKDGNYVIQKSTKKIQKEIGDKHDLKNFGTVTIPADKLQKEGIGIYKLFAKTKKNNSVSCAANPKDNKYNIGIKVIPYDIDTKKYVYIQMDGGEKNIESNTKYPNAFTKSTTETYVKNIFQQAVLDVESVEGKTILEGKGINIHNELLEVDMTNMAASTLEFRKKLHTMFEAFNVTNNLDKKSENWHIAIAINKMRKKWELSKCKSDVSSKIDLSYCPNFNPEEEFIGTEYTLKSSTFFGLIPTGTKSVIITTTPYLYSSGTENAYGGYSTLTGKMYRNYHIYDINEKKIIEPEDGDVLYTDNGYPIIPSYSGKYKPSGTYAYSLPFKKGTHIDLEKEPLDLESFDDYLPYGSLTVTPRGKGESSLYIFVHELGHSFGLTDVSHTNDTQLPILYDPTKKSNIEYDSRFVQNDWSMYRNDYATFETNTMSYVIPTGPTIRYRDIPITCTGGLIYYIKKEGEEKPKPFARGPHILEGNGEKQWDCLHNCFKHELSTFNRKQFFVTDKDDKDLLKKVFGDKNNECIDPTKQTQTHKYEDYLIAYFNKLDILAHYFSVGDMKINYDNLIKEKKYDEAEAFLEMIIPHYTLNQLKDYFHISFLKDYFSSEDLKNCYDPATKKKCFDDKDLEEIK